MVYIIVYFFLSVQKQRNVYKTETQINMYCWNNLRFLFLKYLIQQKKSFVMVMY